MKLWLGISTGNEYTHQITDIHPLGLISFFYRKILEGAAPFVPKGLDLFLDSGAFSAHNSGKDVDLAEYCAFIHNTPQYWDTYVNLDVIPGTGGVLVTPEERDRAAGRGWQNYLDMKADGLDPIPVYHYGESKKWLHKMLDHGCGYIGLGGMVGMTTKMRAKWLDSIFRELSDDAGMPAVKTHGFGITSTPLMLRYPWYSVDSTSWLVLTLNGYIYLPLVGEDGSWRYDVTPQTVTCSRKHSHMKQEGKHSAHFRELAKARLTAWLEECGVNWEQVATDYQARARCNLIVFHRMAEHKLAQPFTSAYIQSMFF